MGFGSVLITGGAGFIGSNLTEKLLSMGRRVVCVDNMMLGSRKNVQEFLNDQNYELIEMDASDIDALEAVMRDEQIERVYHLAANSDIQKSGKCPGIDIKSTFFTTYAVVEAMRRTGVKKLFFSSTGAVYGDKGSEIMCEDMGALSPISYYGGGKLASEAFISAYSYMNDFEALIFRFPNVIGPKLTHGVIFDFIRKLKKDPTELEIFGDGTQCKPYIFVLDLVDAIIEYSYKSRKGVEIFNVGVENATTVNEIADMVCQRMGLKNVRYKYTGGSIGWKGDVPQYQYDLSKIYATGWHAAHDSNEAVKATLDSLEI